VKRIFLLTICAVIFWCSQILLNCSSPLESIGGNVPSPPSPAETVFVHDTVFLGDSICDTVYDTVAVIDTVHDSAADTIYDTIVVIDTISDSTTDTIFVIDTVIQTDTIIDSVIDTVIVFDTVSDTIIDTLIIIEPDTNGTMILCSQISSCNREIVWLFRNAEGMFHLEFVAEAQDEFGKRTLFVEIEGHKYVWKPDINPELIIDRHLSANATIKIYPDKPPAFGHSIDICLTMTRQ